MSYFYDMQLLGIQHDNRFHLTSRKVSLRHVHFVIYNICTNTVIEI